MSYEGLGTFYLGKGYDIDSKSVNEHDFVAYPSADLTTHGLCIGMTGSGKTGLCLSLLEEAAIDKIPAIIIDPKGDMSNLVLNFPDLKPQDFAEWLSESEAQKQNISIQELSENKAKLWADGIKEWDQTKERIATLASSTEKVVYTPGSEDGVQLALIQSLNAPKFNDELSSRDRSDHIESVVSGILQLIDVDADVDDAEFLLFTLIIEYYWNQGDDLDFQSLLMSVKTPPFSKVGMLDLESVCPKSMRQKLMLKLNGVLASSRFETRCAGAPLNIDSLLYSANGKVKTSIISIAHLDEGERMYFVTTLLNAMIRWMRKQSGTSSLRALLYMDEIYGYFPPVSNPPSKKPMLTLLKQARAHGLGILLASQNPGDIDYKGLSNIGTWFIGRLQTDRDKEKIIAGLKASIASVDTDNIIKSLASLKSRVFLMRNVHNKSDSGVKVFHTRWALSYLKGPMTGSEIKKICAKFVKMVVPKISQKKNKTELIIKEDNLEDVVSNKPQLALDAKVDCYLQEYSEEEVFSIKVLTNAKVHFVSSKYKIDTWVDVKNIFDFDNDDLNWNDFSLESDFTVVPTQDNGADFAELPKVTSWKSKLKKWQSNYKQLIYREGEVNIFVVPTLKLASNPMETEAAFRGRIRHVLNEKRDEKVAKLQKKYEKKLEMQQRRIQRAEEKLQREEEQFKHQKMQTAVSFGATLLGAFFGRKVASVGNVRRAASSMRSVSKQQKEKGDISIAAQNVLNTQSDYQDIKDNLEDEVFSLNETFDPENLSLEEVVIKPRKSDIDITKFVLAWIK